MAHMNLYTPLQINMEPENRFPEVFGGSVLMCRGVAPEIHKSARVNRAGRSGGLARVVLYGAPRRLQRRHGEQLRFEKS